MAGKCVATSEKTCKRSSENKGTLVHTMLKIIQQSRGSPSGTRTLLPCRVSKGTNISDGPTFDTQLCRNKQKKT